MVLEIFSVTDYFLMGKIAAVSVCVLELSTVPAALGALSG
jgi:hypothetical protein